VVSAIKPDKTITPHSDSVGTLATSPICTDAAVVLNATLAVLAWVLLAVSLATKYSM